MVLAEGDEDAAKQEGELGVRGSPIRDGYSHISLIDPHLLPQFASDVSEPFLAVKAESLNATVAEHLDDLCILCGLALDALRQQGEVEWDGDWPWPSYN